MEFSMKLSAWFPTRDIGNDPARIRDWAQAAEDLGYDYIEVPDHVFGATGRNGWTPLYDAKQAAQVDILSQGRLRLGIGVGWNHVEYQALGEDWHARGARQGEQVDVMRRLWTEDLVTYKGRFHDMTEVNIVPRPIQQPIPIWFGGSSDAVIKRAARIGDGWMPIITPDEQAEAKLDDLRGHLKSFGREPESFGLEGWLRMSDDDPQTWAAAADGWCGLGAQIVMLYPMYRITSFDGQIETLRRFKDVVGV
jgi:probable F420-dependent oxidoreductase